MTNTPRTLTMIGTGYVGLVSGTCFAELGFNVTCVDVDAVKINNLAKHGILPIFEPGLKEIVDRNVAAGRLKFSTTLADNVAQADAVFIAVGTPQDEDGSADLQYVEAAARQVADHLQGYTVIVNKSTVPVGTGAKVAQIIEGVIKQSNPSAEFDVASNPEFLREGEAMGDFMNPDRVVIGVESDRARDLLAALYQPLIERGARLHVTNRASSELIKYASNAFLAVKITFVNELIALCDKVGADILAVATGMGLDARIAPRFLQPGPGYGGSCFPKDTHALVKTASDHGVSLSVVETTIAANQRIKESMTDRITAALGGSAKGKSIAALGLAFKANTDDMRDASCLTILPALQAQGAMIHAYDPEAMSQAQQKLPASASLQYHEDAWAAVTQADAVVILTDWAEFRTLDLERLKSSLKQPVMVDLRNIYDPASMRAQGFSYHPLGRP